MLERLGALVAGLGENTGVFLLSSPRVWNHWGAKLRSSRSEASRSAPILFDDREKAKTLRTVEKLCRKLIYAGADRDSILIAMGGGVVGDVVGFVAACYMRGVGVVQVPTTLVAQVDSAVGGKTGVNLPEGKNLVGAFYQPRLVVVDPELLRTLPKQEYRAGLYEVIKYGIIGDELLFRFLERHLEKLLRRDAAALDWVVSRCIRAKARVVSRDERESGLRQMLNFGHTIGHALEAVTRYNRFLHGEAVAWGMISAAELAVEMNRLKRDAARRIARLVLRVGPLPALPKTPLGRLLQLMHADKKSRGGRLHFVLPRRIGKVEIMPDVPEGPVRKVIADLARSKIAGA
jgi:3-dehydroquinate synthase